MAPHPPRKPEVDSARVKFHHASAKVVPPWGCGAFFWGGGEDVLCKGWVGFHKNILMLLVEVKLSLRSLLMVGRQCICHLEHLQNHGISFSKHPFKLPNFPAQRHLYIRNSIWKKHMGPGKASRKTKVGHWWAPWIIQISPPQRVVWLHHHSLANWDSNIRSSSESDHSGLDTGRTGQLACFFVKKSWARR